MTLPESETVDHPCKREENTQNTDRHNTIKLTSNQLNYKGHFNHTTLQLRTQHKTPHKSEEIKRRIFGRVHYIQYAVTSISFNIFVEGIYYKCIRATRYTLSYGLGRDKLAMSTVCGHRELIIYPIDPNGETLVFDSLFCISQHMWGITICLKFKQKHELREKERKKHTFTRSFFNYCMLCNGCHILGKPRPGSN